MEIKNDVAEIIIATWLNGLHLEDVKIVHPNELGEYGSIASLIRRGIHDPLEIARQLKLKPSEIGRLMQAGFVNLYESAMLAIKHDKMTEELEEACGRKAKTKEIAGIVKKYDTQPVEIRNAEVGIVEKYICEIDRRENAEIVRTEIGSVDRMMYGIRPKELTSVGARPSVGKSAFLLQVAVSVAKQGKKVLYFPLEMSTEQTVERILARYLSKTPMSALKTGKMSREQWAEVQEHLCKVQALESSGNFLIYEGCGQLEEIEAIVQKEKPYLVVVDQLQQMKALDHFADVRTRFSHMTNSLKRLAMEYGVAVWLACQVNRVANKNAGKEPTMENLKESGSIEEDSDNVLLLHRDEDYEDANGVNDRVIQVNVAKQREGATGKVKLLFVPERFAFYDIEPDVNGYEQVKYDDVEF